MASKSWEGNGGNNDSQRKAKVLDGTAKNELRETLLNNAEHNRPKINQQQENFETMVEFNSVVKDLTQSAAKLNQCVEEFCKKLQRVELPAAVTLLSALRADEEPSKVKVEPAMPQPEVVGIRESLTSQVAKRQEQREVDPSIRSGWRSNIPLLPTPLFGGGGAGPSYERGHGPTGHREDSQKFKPFGTGSQPQRRDNHSGHASESKAKTKPATNVTVEPPPVPVVVVPPRYIVKPIPARPISPPGSNSYKHVTLAGLGQMSVDELNNARDMLMAKIQYNREMMKWNEFLTQEVRNAAQGEDERLRFKLERGMIELK